MPGLTRDRREGEAELGGHLVTLIDTAGLEEAAPGSIAGAHARAERGGDRQGRPGAVRARHPRRRDAGRCRLRARRARVRAAGDPGRQQERGPRRRATASTRRSGWGSASRWRSRPSTARASASWWRPCWRRSASSRSRAQGRPTARETTAAEPEERPPDPRGHRRQAQRRQVDPGQRAARRGAHDHRARARPHARCGRHRLPVGRPARAPVRHGGAAGARRASPRRPRSCPPATRCAPSASPRWWWC